MDVLRNRESVVVHGHFDDVNRFPNDFINSLTHALDSITQSDGEADVVDFMFELLITKVYEQRGGTKFATIARKAIGNGDAGLYVEPTTRRG